MFNPSPSVTSFHFTDEATYSGVVFKCISGQEEDVNNGVCALVPFFTLHCFSLGDHVMAITETDLGEI